jgi:putative Holliday junction resolvase
MSADGCPLSAAKAGSNKRLLKAMTRILAIDFGERRIGLAISDPLGITAQGLPTIDTRKTKDFLSFIQNLIQEKEVSKVVVGMPRNMDGSIGFKGEAVKEFIQKLSQKTKVEIITWDERLTSVESLRSMREMGTKQKKKETVDRISATLILQSYLDSQSMK